MKNSKRLTIVAAFTVLLGCSEPRGDRAILYPVRGRVMFKGPPAQEAMIVFHPASPPKDFLGKPFASIADDGTFVVSTYETGDGMQPGEYVATIIWRLPGLDDEPGKDVLVQTKYGSPKTSPLKVTIETRQQELEPFRLD